MSLAARAVAQSVGFFGVVFVLVFAPAGTLRDPRPWVYFGTFAACSTVATAWLFAKDRPLLERRLAMSERGETRPRQRVAQSILALACVAMLVVAGFDRRFGWSPPPVAASFAADGVVALSFAIVMRVFRENSYASAVVEVAEKQKVVTTGPYRVVRHPMYAGALLLIFGTPIALGSLVSEAFALGLFVGVVVRLLDEERFLREELDGYDAYTRATRFRLVPFVW